MSKVVRAVAWVKKTYVRSIHLKEIDKKIEQSLQEPATWLSILKETKNDRTKSTR